MSNRGVARCAVAAVLFGVSAPAAAQLAGDMNAFMLAGLLYLGAAVAVTPFATREWPAATAARRSVVPLGTAVVFGGAVGPVLLAAGLRHTPAATASLMLNLELVFTGVLAYFVFREHLGARVVAGTALVVAAGATLGWSGNADVRWGVVLIAAACLCWAVDNCVTANLDTLTPSQITFVKGVVAGGVNLTIGLALGGDSPGRSMLWALVVGGFGYGASITLWVAGARELGAARGQLVFATAPFVGAIVAWTAFGEPVAGREVVALTIAAAGVSLVLRSEHAHQHRHDELEHDHEHVHDDGHHTHEHDGIDVPPGHRHHHVHRHAPLVHSHPHVPDLHHRHEHHEH